MRPFLVPVLLLLAPALHAEGRNDLLMSCTFGVETFEVREEGGALRLFTGAASHDATLALPDRPGVLGAVFAMSDTGPVTIAVDTARGAGRDHTAQLTASARGADGSILTRTTPGTCTEGNG